MLYIQTIIYINKYLVDFTFIVNFIEDRIFMQCKFFSGHIDDKDVFILVSQLFYTSNFPNLLEFVVC